MKKKKQKYKKVWFNEWLIVMPLLLAALIFRMVYLGQAEINDPTFWHPGAGTDMLTYDNYAQDILKGKHPAPYYYGPLYSYFLSVVYFVFGHNLYIARFIQHILGVLTCLLIYLIAKGCFGNPVGYISLFISVIYDMFILHEGLLLIEFLSTFLNALLLFLLLRAGEGFFSYKRLALAGIAIGLSALARANILLFVPFILIWMLITQGAGLITLKKFAFLCLIVFLAISPATIMNYIYSKKFVLISTNGPISLWVGNNEKADGAFLQPPLSDRLTKRLKEIGDKAYIEDVIRFIKEKPRIFANLTLRKFLLFWGSFEVANNMNYEQMKNWSPFMRMPFFMGFGMIAPLGLLGIFLAGRNNKTLLLNFFIFSFMVATVGIFVLARYRIAVLPALIPFSAFTITWLYKKIRQGRWKPIFTAFLIFIPCLLLVHQKTIADASFPFLHPDGVYTKDIGRLTISDTTKDWGGGSAVMLNKNKGAKKELMINKEPSSYKKITLCFKYGTTEMPGRLVVDINGKGKGFVDLTFTEGLVKYISLSLAPSLLHKGKNSFVFTIQGETIFALPYDTSYSFGRSFEETFEGWKKIKKGEFFVWLELEK